MSDRSPSCLSVIGVVLLAIVAIAVISIGTPWAMITMVSWLGSGDAASAEQQAACALDDLGLEADRSRVWARDFGTAALHYDETRDGVEMTFSVVAFSSRAEAEASVESNEAEDRIQSGLRGYMVGPRQPLPIGGRGSWARMEDGEGFVLGVLRRRSVIAIRVWGLEPESPAQLAEWLSGCVDATYALGLEDQVERDQARPDAERAAQR